MDEFSRSGAIWRLSPGVVVVDDTPLGIAAGRNAGAWTIAISKTGNTLGLSAAEVSALPAAELKNRLTQIEANFRAAGAHVVIDSVANLPAHWDEIEQLAAAASSSRAG